MEYISNLLYENQDTKYAAFTHKIIPDISPDTIIGVRTPILRKLAKQIKQSRSQQNHTKGKRKLPYHPRAEKLSGSIQTERKKT